MNSVRALVWVGELDTLQGVRFITLENARCSFLTTSKDAKAITGISLYDTRYHDQKTSVCVLRFGGIGNRQLVQNLRTARVRRVGLSGAHRFGKESSSLQDSVQALLETVRKGRRR